MALTIKIKPISKWIGKQNAAPKSSLFKQTYSDTKKILENELWQLQAVESSVQLEMFIKQEDLRFDGELRANAKPSSPGVVLSFSRVVSREIDKRSGERKNNLKTLTYPCDTFDFWQCNLRGIALSLVNLRAVARYGVFKYEDMVDRLALASADGKISDAADALAFLSECSGTPLDELEFSIGVCKSVYLTLLKKFHPDTGGSADDFLRLQKAREIIGF